jgi:hypothetical protein
MRPRLLVAAVLGLACSAGEAERSDLLAVRLDAVSDLRVGSPDDPDLAFTWFRALDVGSGGRIYTMHSQENTIRMHRPDGTPFGTIGREGEGPGEFTNLGRMGFLSDTLWVLDFGEYRFNYFTPDGDLLGTRTIRFTMGGPGGDNPPRPSGHLPDGGFAAAPPTWAHEVAAGTITQRVVLRVDTAGHVIDTILTAPLEHTVLEVPFPSGGGSYRTQPFSDAEFAAYSDHEPVIVHVSRAAATAPGVAAFTVTKLRFGGDTVFSRTFDYEPIPLDRAIIDSLVREIGEQVSSSRFGSAPTQARAEELARAAIYAPAFHPPVSSVTIGRDGTLWLAREETRPDSVPWSVLSADGAPIGTVMLPGGFRLMQAERGTVWGMERDELDVPYVVRYRIEPSQASNEPS